MYQQNETAWLEAMVELIRPGRVDEVDFSNLADYLSDTARRDRREVESRLIVLIAHALKWTHQPDRRTGRWRGKVIEKWQELAGLVSQGVLQNHAEAVLPDVCRKAVERAAAETRLPSESIPADCPYLLEDLLSADLITE